MGQYFLNGYVITDVSADEPLPSGANTVYVTYEAGTTKIAPNGAFRVPDRVILPTFNPDGSPRGLFIPWSNTELGVPYVPQGSVIAAVGDSTVAGFNMVNGGTNQVINSWPMQLAGMLSRSSAQNRWGTASGTFATLLQMDGRVTSTGAWSQTATFAPGGNAYGATAAGSMTFTPNQNVNHFDLYWRDGAVGRTFTYSVNGGAAVTVTSSGTTRVVKTSVHLPVPVSSNIVLTWSAGTVIIFGIDAYDDSLGLPTRVWNFGISGATSTQLVDNSDTAGGRTAAYNAGNADLWIIEGGIVNDWRQNIPVATSKANLTTLVNLAKSQKGNTGRAILITPPADSDMSNSGPIQGQYVQAMREVAIEQNVPLIDIRPLNPGQVDPVHFSTAGNTTVATQVMKFLTGQIADAKLY